MQTIFIAGPKHAGKTSAARALAALYSCGFIDLDEVIARRSGKSPRTLYGEGPEIFRKAEAEALAALFEPAAEDGVNSQKIVALGGGLIDNPGALALLEHAESSLVVYLAVSAGTAWKRICGGGELPPFLRTGNPQETHCALHKRRSAAYRKLARITIEAEGKSPREIALEIFNQAPNQIPGS
jgi:shikimate kinase